MFQIRIHGRGGQGVVSASEMMSVAAFLGGRYSMSFPSFGSERMGAPVIAFVRIDDKEIELREPVLDPDCLIIQDPTLFHAVDVFSGLKQDGYVLINSRKDAAELGVDDAVKHLPKGHVVATEVEAMDLAPTLLDLAGLPIPDSMQGQSVLGPALDELAYSPATSMTQNGTMTRGIKSGRYRMIHSGPGRITLFDEIEDPREQADLAGQRPIALRQMRNILALQAGFENVWKKRVWGSPANPNEAFYSANDR